jgi:hypothetical protein
MAALQGPWSMLGPAGYGTNDNLTPCQTSPLHHNVTLVASEIPSWEFVLHAAEFCIRCISYIRNQLDRFNMYNAPGPLANVTAMHQR